MLGARPATASRTGTSRSRRALPMAEIAETELVRLPVTADGEERVMTLCDGNPYFGQDGLLEHRLLCDLNEPAVVLILEWESRAAADRALRTPIGRRFLAELEPLLNGAPEIGHYRARS